jgi:hypothetical protein
MTADMHTSSWSFCRDILPDVSRSFALIIPQCPPPIDAALCVAYLLCRVADTVEDEVGLTRARRDRLYDGFLAAGSRLAGGRGGTAGRAGARSRTGRCGPRTRRRGGGHCECEAAADRVAKRRSRA